LPDVVAFGRFVRLAAQRSRQLLNIKSIGADCGIDQRTAASYLHLLEMTFQMERLAPWQASDRKRLVKTPKIFMLDSGLACSLHGITNPDSLESAPSFGALAETWARAELRKQAALLSGTRWTFYRTHQGREVDFVLEQGKRRLGIDVKLATSLSRSDFAGLLDMQVACGKGARGVLVYLGREVVPIGDGLIAAPLDHVV
jgi:hypothetical protein